MRITLVTAAFLPDIGGAQHCVHQLAREWVNAGHEVTVVSPSPDFSVDPTAGYRVRQLRLLRGSTRFGYHRFPFKQWAVLHLQRIIDQCAPDFISAHFAYPTAVWLAHLSHPPPIILTCHGGDITKAPWGARARYRIDAQLRRALRRPDRLVAISRSARRLLEELGTPADRIVDIPNGVDAERFLSPVQIDLRKQLGIHKGEMLILSVGHNRPPKGFEVGIDAFASATQKGLQGYYLIVGGDTGPLSDLAKKLGIKNRVLAHSPLSGEQLVAAYQQADIYFAPSWDELFPLVVLEAMASSLPIVATDVSGHQDIIENSINGFLVESGDPEAMAQALIALASDPSRRNAMGKANREKVSDFHWKKISRRYLIAVQAHNHEGVDRYVRFAPVVRSDVRER